MTGLRSRMAEIHRLLKVGGYLAVDDHHGANRDTDALAIALRNFDLPSNEEDYARVERVAADAIIEEWKLGVRHMTVLANKAIAAVEEHHPLADKLQPPEPS